MDADRVHIVHVEWRKRLVSETLAAEALARLQAAFSPHWFSGAWCRPALREAIAHTMQAESPGGLVLIGRGMQFTTPPPFEHRFEPVALGMHDPQLVTLAGPGKTREEKTMAVVWAIVAVGLIAVIGPIIGALFHPPLRSLAVVTGSLVLGVGAIVAVIALVGKLGKRWFLVPGGVVIAPHRPRAAAPPLLLTRRDACAALRYVHTGKTVILTLELWPREGKPLRRAVSQREAIAFLAAWQCRLPSPTIRQMQELIAA